MGGKCDRPGSQGSHLPAQQHPSLARAPDCSWPNRPSQHMQIQDDVLHPESFWSTSPPSEQPVSMGLPSWKSSVCRAWDGKAGSNHNLLLTLPVGPGTGVQPEPVRAECVPRLLQACGHVHSHTRVAMHMCVPRGPEWASRERSVCGWRVPCSTEERHRAELGPGCCWLWAVHLAVAGSLLMRL